MRKLVREHAKSTLCATYILLNLRLFHLFLSRFFTLLILILLSILLLLGLGHGWIVKLLSEGFFIESVLKDFLLILVRNMASRSLIVTAQQLCLGFVVLIAFIDDHWLSLFYHFDF